jgi:hypothetical protein
LSPKGSRRPESALDELAQLAQAPAWIKRRMQLSKKALQEIASKRGKSLKVYKGLDTLGI